MAVKGGVRALDQAALASVAGGAPGVEIEGGDGQDFLIAGAGHDFIGGGDGRDRLIGNGGDDTMCGGQGGDTLQGDGLLPFGGAGHDLLAGGSGDDLVQAGGGDDTVAWMAGDGFDTVQGGSGTDTLLLENPGVTLEELMTRFSLDPGSPPPVLRDGYIELKGVSGQILLPGEAITFTGMERLFIKVLD
jgi:Ca2+-binding RTX toxin-like protein